MKKLVFVKINMYKLFEEYVNVRSTSSAASSCQLVPLIEQDFNLEEIQGLENMDLVVVS